MDGGGGGQRCGGKKVEGSPAVWGNEGGEFAKGVGKGASRDL